VRTYLVDGAGAEGAVGGLGEPAGGVGAGALALLAVAGEMLRFLGLPVGLLFSARTYRCGTVVRRWCT